MTKPYPQTAGVEGPHYAIIPEWIVFHADLNAAAVRVYAVLARHEGKAGCYPSVGTIATEAHMNEKTVAAARAQLVDVGAIEVLPRYDKGRQTSNRYRLAGDQPLAENRGSAPPKIGGEEGAENRGTNVSPKERISFSKENEAEGEKGIPKALRGPRPPTHSDARARLIADAVWKGSDPKPALGYPQVLAVARKLAAVRSDDPVIVAAMLAAPTVTVAAVEVVLNKRKPKNRAAEDWQATFAETGGA